MSDVYVAFVRDDQSYAEALAVALQGSGFVVSRSSSVVEAIDTCGAIVVLWTPAAARSKLFIDAADRAFRAGKMVLARMGQDPLPPMFTGAEVHSLARWSGDPESPDIDTIVFHVDRLVNRGRPRPGPAPPEPPETGHLPRGVVHQFPNPGPGGAVRAARPVEPARAPQTAYPMPAGDPLAEEAAYWRRIQQSTDPGEFYAYLDRYGRNGAFAELAEARVRTLAAARAPRPQAPPQVAPHVAPMPAPMPQPMQTAPINRGGGRGLVLLIFLAVIVGGGYYIYNELQGPAPSTLEDSVEPWSPPAGSPAEPEPTTGEESDVRPVPAPAAPRTRVATAEPEPEPPPPAPVFRTLAPVPPPQATTPPPASAATDSSPDFQRDVGPVLSAPPLQVASAPAAQAAATVRPRWARRPSDRDLRAAYPASAQRLNVEGRVELDCLIGTDLAIRCRARSETPAGYGFSAAALRVAQAFRAAPTLMDGRPAAGERAQVTLIFRPE